MKAKYRPAAPTRLQEFLDRHDVAPSELSRASGVTNQALSPIRAGSRDPRRRTLAAILYGARVVTGNTAIQITDLFDMEAGPLPGAASGDDWRRKRARRPRKTDYENDR
jgi:transcriptional regulator with XRE-family HTH domain